MTYSQRIILLKRKYLFFDKLKIFLIENKITLIFIFFFILLSCITGVFCTLKSCKEYDYCLIQNILFKKYFLKEINLFGFLIIKTLFSLTVFLILFVLTRFKIGWFISFAILFYIGYLCGVDTCIAIKVLGGVKGIFFIIIAYLPCQILIYYINYIFCFKFIKYSTKNEYCRGLFTVNNIKIISMFLFFVFCLILLQITLLFLITKIFVFV